MKRTITFAENLRHYRTQAGLTQKQLAEQIGYTEKSVSKWEGGNALPTMDIALNLSELFGISLDELLFEHTANHYFLGIDGGGTKTAFKLMDKDGLEVARVAKGPTNPYDVGIENAIATLKDGIHEVCKGIPYNKITVFAGLAGFGMAGDNTKILFRFLSKFGFLDFAYGSDIENIAALSAHEKCILVIMGTGFVAYALNGSTKARVAGWGQFFDDGGCGYTLGKDAITATLSAEDGSGAPTALTELFTQRLGQTPSEHLARFYLGGKRYIAEFADLVFKAAEQDDPIAWEILERNTAFVASKITAAMDKLPDSDNLPVLFAGGISRQHKVLFPLIGKHLGQARCQLLHLEQEPVDGAVLRAQKLFYEKEDCQ